MLKLAGATDPAWLEAALASLDDVLLDHAHCEKKAAGAALNLIFAYPDRSFLLAPLSRLAREELTHFEQVLGFLARRRIAFDRQRPSPYGSRLRELVRQGEPERLMDLLLVSSLIEARSCERFRLLADAVEDPELAGFYRGLLASEARHHQIYVELAENLAAREVVQARLEDLAAREIAILGAAGPWVRMHS